MIDAEGLKDVNKAMQEALKLMKTTTQGIPERISALEDVSKHEAEMITEAMGKLNEVMADITKQTKGFKF